MTTYTGHLKVEIVNPAGFENSTVLHDIGIENQWIMEKLAEQLDEKNVAGYRPTLKLTAVDDFDDYEEED